MTVIPATSLPARTHQYDNESATSFRSRLVDFVGTANLGKQLWRRPGARTARCSLNAGIVLSTGFKEVTMLSGSHALAATLCAAPLLDIDPLVFAGPRGAVEICAHVVAATCQRSGFRRTTLIVASARKESEIA